MQSLLGGLPELWQIDILLQWLNDKRYYNNLLSDFGRLDIAFCCKSQRPAWLKLLSSEHFTVGGVCLKRCVQWILLRGVRMDTISIDKEFSKFVASHVSTLNLSKIHTILFMESQHMYAAHEQASHQESLQLIFSQCHALTSLTIIERELNFCRFDDALFYALGDQQLKQLKILSFTRFYCDPKVISRVTDFCESLEYLTVRENLSRLFTPGVLTKCVNKFRRLRIVDLDCYLTVEVVNAMATCLPLIEKLSLNEKTDFSQDKLKVALMKLIRKSLFLKDCVFHIGLIPFAFNTAKDKFLCVHGPSSRVLTITQKAHHYEWLAFVLSLDHIASEVIGLLLDIPLNDWCLNQMAHALPNIRHVQLINEHSDYNIEGLRTFLMKCTQLVKVYCTDCHHLPIVELVELLFSSVTLTGIGFRHKGFEPRMMDDVKLSDSLVRGSINESHNTAWVYEKNASA